MSLCAERPPRSCCRLAAASLSHRLPLPFAGLEEEKRLAATLEEENQERARQAKEAERQQDENAARLAELQVLPS